MNVFWMLLRGLLQQQQWLQRQAQKAAVTVSDVPPIIKCLSLKGQVIKGQGIVEYSGALVVAGILVVAVITQVNPTMGPWFVSILGAVSTSVQQWL